MTTQTIDPRHFAQKARQIRAQVATVLKKWGLLPRFKRWRLTQDPGTGMVVLFGILNDRYIATHTTIPFRDYFDPCLLHDLANELQVQVVSCNTAGLRYAFILDRGELGRLPTHVDFPFVENGKLLVRVVYSDSPPSRPTPPVEAATVDDHRLVRQGVGAFLKVFDDIKLRNDALQLSAQSLPDIVVIDEDEFNKRVAEHEANQQKIKPGLLPTK
ncbi:MAG: response regulator transcription factor [Anaerolineales bacterium]|nr:response regulator transcription factor [Anaerolineales bacterium]